ncbi:interphotoreceptor matrix proteoglycan 1-like isoform X2 [Acipenser ruthenus]|uniref:interphotoreceptor matrix proteoglycan 1-like isoform X2 n=1 Tax=Acipenser ruthenus TaxID=7906 RepID=UPI0027426655|nr:interphotoreceptor matrix proteoglycan 1-like isoform X2 [Acipenser ruthenus]
MHLKTGLLFIIFLFTCHVFGRTDMHSQENLGEVKTHVSIPRPGGLIDILKTTKRSSAIKTIFDLERHRTKRSAFFHTGVKVCPEESIKQIIESHQAYYKLRVCQEAVWEAFWIFLDRIPETTEYQSWVNTCQQDSLCIADIAKNFSSSPEHVDMVLRRVTLKEENLKERNTEKPTVTQATPEPTRASVEAVTASASDVSTPADTLPNEIVNDTTVSEEDLDLPNAVPEEPVEQVVEFSITLIDQDYSELLSNPSTPQYQDLARSFQDQMTHVFDRLPGFKEIRVLRFGRTSDHAGSSSVAVRYAVVFEEGDANMNIDSNKVESEKGPFGSELQLDDKPTGVYTVSTLQDLVAKALRDEKALQMDFASLRFQKDNMNQAAFTSTSTIPEIDNALNAESPLEGLFTEYSVNAPFGMESVLHEDSDKGKLLEGAEMVTREKSYLPLITITPFLIPQEPHFLNELPGSSIDPAVEAEQPDQSIESVSNVKQLVDEQLDQEATVEPVTGFVVTEPASSAMPSATQITADESEFIYIYQYEPTSMSVLTTTQSAPIQEEDQAETVLIQVTDSTLESYVPSSNDLGTSDYMEATAAETSTQVLLLTNSQDPLSQETVTAHPLVDGDHKENFTRPVTTISALTQQPPTEFITNFQPDEEDTNAILEDDNININSGLEGEIADVENDVAVLPLSTSQPKSATTIADVKIGEENELSGDTETLSILSEGEETLLLPDESPAASPTLETQTDLDIVQESVTMSSQTENHLFYSVGPFEESVSVTPLTIDVSSPSATTPSVTIYNPSTTESVITESTSESVTESTGSPTVALPLTVQTETAVNVEEMTETSVLNVITTTVASVLTDPFEVGVALQPAMAEPVTDTSPVITDEDLDFEVGVKDIAAELDNIDVVNTATIDELEYGSAYISFTRDNPFEGTASPPLKYLTTPSMTTASKGKELVVFFSLRVTNMMFSDDLFNKSSPEYRSLENTFLGMLLPYLQSNLTGFKQLEILNFRNGSVIVNSKLKFAKSVPYNVTQAVHCVLEDFCNAASKRRDLEIDSHSLDIEPADQADPCKFMACNEFSRCVVNRWTKEAGCVCDPGYHSEDGLPCQSVCNLQPDYCLNGGQCEIIPGQGAACRHVHSPYAFESTVRVNPVFENEDAPLTRVPSMRCPSSIDAVPSQLAELQALDSIEHMHLSTEVPRYLYTTKPDKLFSEIVDFHRCLPQSEKWQLPKSGEHRTSCCPPRGSQNDMYEVTML